MATSEVTPNRKTHIRLGVAEPTSSEPPQAMSRAGNEMARSGFGPNNSSSVTRLAAGGISLEPYQKQMTALSEQTDTAGTIVALSQFSTIPGYVERPHYKGPDYLHGVTLAPDTVASGQPMAEKTVPAAQSGGWAQTLTQDAAAYPAPSFSSVLTDVDRHAVSTIVFDENQAHTFRYRTPTGHAYNATAICFYFGGPVNSSGNGQYCIECTGRYIILYEYNLTAPGLWTIVDHWQYLLNANPGEDVTLHVRPYRGAKGNLFIEFEGSTQSHVGNSSNNSQLNMSIRAAPQGITTHIFKVDTSRTSPAAPPAGTPSRTKVTGQGPVRIDMPRELRLPWQVSVWRFLPTGYFEDYPVTMPWHITPRSLITLYWTADIPAGTMFVARLMDATTRTELTAGGTSGNGYRQYQVNVGQPNYYVRIEMASDSAQKATPVLYGYEVQRDSIGGVNAPGEIDTYADGVNISGPEADPSHETASCRLRDFTNVLGILGTRAAIRTRIETEYDPAHTNLRSVLFDGYLQKAPGQRRGTKGNVYPAAHWRDFECTFVGMWMRLQRSLTMFRLDLQKQDPSTGPDAQGNVVPLKVTDICRALIGYAGFSPAQIDVPDSPVRFYPGGTENGQSLMIDPLSNVAETVVRFAKDYLGWFLIWDGNAGTAGGMWRLRAPVPRVGPYNNLASFTLDSQPAGKVATFSESYNGDTHGLAWVGSSGAIPTVPIMRGTFRPYPKPPEGNAVCVTATGNMLPNNGQFALTNWVCNPKSYDFFTDAGGNLIVTSDPSDPDYLGFFAPIVVVNLGLGAGEEGQHNVNMFARRTYDVSCHGIKMAPFTAPLCLVVDPNDGNQVTPRPLRYYDPVTIVDDGVVSQFLVRNCNPTFKKDSIQYASYELEAPRTD